MRQELRSTRTAIGLSQSRLARLSGVPRYKICTFELGDGALSSDEEGRIRNALQGEADRLRDVSAHLDFGQQAGMAEQARR
jgi:transcriptional regulator with XRE-family HTH domain